MQACESLWRRHDLAALYALFGCKLLLHAQRLCISLGSCDKTRKAGSESLTGDITWLPSGFFSVRCYLRSSFREITSSAGARDSYVMLSSAQVCPSCNPTDFHVVLCGYCGKTKSSFERHAIRLSSQIQPVRHKRSHIPQLLAQTATSRDAWRQPLPTLKLFASSQESAARTKKPPNSSDSKSLLSSITRVVFPQRLRNSR